MIDPYEYIVRNVCGLIVLLPRISKVQIENRRYELRHVTAAI